MHIDRTGSSTIWARTAVQVEQLFMDNFIRQDLARLGETTLIAAFGAAEMKSRIPDAAKEYS